MTIGELMVKLGFNVDKSSESKAKQSIDGMKNLAGKALGAIGVTLSIAGISNLSETASSLNALDSQFTQTFGSMEKKAQESLDSIAEYAGMNAGRIKGSYSQIAGFAKTTGADEAEAIDLADRAMRVAADSAAYYDRSIEQVTENLQSFLKGNYENDSALGLSATETTRNAKANELYGKSFNDLSEQQKQLTLLQMVEDANKASGALGQAARESDQYTNVMGNMKQGLTEFKGALGQIVLKPMTNGVKLLTDLLNKGANAVKDFTAGTTPLNKVLDRCKGILEKLKAPAERVLNIFGSGLSDIGINGSLLDKAVGTISDKVDGFLSLCEKGADAVSNFLTPERIQWAADTIIPVVQDVGYTFNSVFNMVKTLARTVFGWLSTFWKNWGSQVIAVFEQFIQNIAFSIQTFLALVRGIADFISAVFTGDWQGAWDAICNIFTAIWDVITSYFSRVWTTFQAVFTAGLGILQTLWSSAWSGIQSFFTAIWNGILSVISSIGTTIMNGLQSAIDFITSLPEQALQWGADFVQGLIDGIKSKIAGVIDTVKGIGSAIAEFLHFSRPDKGPLRDYEKWMPDFMKGMGDGIDEGKDSLLRKIKGVAKEMQVLVQAGTPDRSTMRSASQSIRTSNVVQNNTFNNNYSGGSGNDQRVISKGMKKSATDATTEMARGLAYARG